MERGDVHVDPNSSGQRATDEAIARVAGRQGGTISRRQLLRLGLTAKDIEYRIKVGRLRVIYRGVYAVGHDAIPVRGRLFAALLVAGPPAALSHRTAAALHKLIPSMPPFVDLTVTGRRAPRNRRDLAFHRAGTLEATTKHGLPVTTPARTLQDLAATRPEPEVRKALNQALVHRLVAPGDLADRTGPGSAALKRLARITAPTRSGLERRFLAALRQSSIPPPVKEHPIGRYVADFYWPDHRLVVETDGWSTHGGPIAFVHDRIRDAELAIRDVVVIRVSDEQVDRDLAATIGRLERWFSGPGRGRAS
ncbi:MAG: type IV toxin-antitoxin system AbiEi family antitoxin domain-containing protein [Solirubrobacteraceae bacterium]